MRDGRVVPNFITQALQDQPLTVYGDGSQTRSFCYVDDLVEGLIRLLWSDESDPVNIGNPAEMTILQFAEKIIELSGSSSSIDYRPLPEDDPKVRQPDITKAKRVLDNWGPKVSLEDGLRSTIAYFKQKLEMGA
jgi:dTDP-glucose 4,6-dehydratase